LGRWAEEANMGRLLGELDQKTIDRLRARYPKTDSVLEDAGCGAPEADAVESAPPHRLLFTA
jgi:hypothetical protein